MSDERFISGFDPILPRLDAAEAGYLSHELSELRDIVTRGDTLAVAGGSVMAWWGLALAVANIFEALMAARWLPRGLPVNWGLTIAGCGGSLLIFWFSRNTYFFRSWRSQSISTTWVFAGIGIFVFMLGSQWTRVSEPHVTMAFLAVVFSLVMAVMATSSNQSWLLGMAGGWMLTACAMFVLDRGLDRYIVMAAATLCFMMVPGLVLLRAEWRARPRLKTAKLRTI